MNWFQKISQVDQYLSGLGAPPETIDWITSQPDSQFFVNQFRQNPTLDLDALSQIQAPQKYRPTQREISRIRMHHPSVQKWALVQLRKMRINPHVSRLGKDYDYSMNMVVFDNKLSQIKDWYALSDRPIDLASYSWDQAVAASDEWHAVSAGRGSGKIYEPTNSKLVVFNPPEWEGWSIQRVVSENDLLVEGNLMNNCIGDYCEQIRHHSSEIYSLRDPYNHPHVSIEINPGYNEIVQIEGNSGKEPDDKYKEYIKQWFAELQKQKPGLRIYNEEQFDFDNLKYVDNRDIDDEINKIVYKGNEYGLKPALAELDVENVYEAVMHEIVGRHSYRGPDTRFVQHIGISIAGVAWDADKMKAEKSGLLDHPYTDKSENYLAFKRESHMKGVDWLYQKANDNNEEFYSNYLDYFESTLSPEDFETEEEYENARTEEEHEVESEARGTSLPYALDNVIVEALGNLAREKPFLKEHAAYKKQASNLVRKNNMNWFQKISQVDPYPLAGAQVGGLRTA